jgi:hypothetical protein
MSNFGGKHHSLARPFDFSCVGVDFGLTLGKADLRVNS